jgi:hypothetical protein
MDIGLMCSALNLNVLDLGKENMSLVNDGALAEQFIGQQLLYSGSYYDPPTLYYWMREAQKRSGGSGLPADLWPAGCAGRNQSGHHGDIEIPAPVFKRKAASLCFAV